MNWTGKKKRKKKQVTSCHSETHFPHHEDELLLPVNMEFKYYFQVLNIDNTLHYVSFWYPLQHDSNIINVLREGWARKFLVAQNLSKVQKYFHFLFSYKPIFNILGHIMPWKQVHYSFNVINQNILYFFYLPHLFYGWKWNHHLPTFPP